MSHEPPLICNTPCNTKKDNTVAPRLSSRLLRWHGSKLKSGPIMAGARGFIIVTTTPHSQSFLVQVFPVNRLSVVGIHPWAKSSMRQFVSTSLTPLPKNGPLNSNGGGVQVLLFDPLFWLRVALLHSNTGAPCLPSPFPGPSWLR